MLFELYSHWIFIWSLLYYFKFISANPTFYLIIAYIVILIGFIILIFLKSSWQNLLFFFIYNSSIKLLPILMISNFTLKLKDIVFGVYFYLLYLFHMIIRNKNPFDFYKDLIHIFSKQSYKNFIKTIINDIYNLWSPFRSRI